MKMFSMKIEQQMNMVDRTLLLGVPEYDIIPKEISIDKDKYKVIGVSHGVKLPYMSLEIENTSKELKGKEIKVV